jgi:hypothetical protein
MQGHIAQQPIKLHGDKQQRMTSKPNSTDQKDNASFAQTNIPVVPMNLEERKAFRREMLYQAIRQSMKSLEVVSSLYKFKIINLDARHHRFLALIEVATTFKARKGSKPQTFPQIEAFLRDNAFEHFGLILERVFWRVSESEKDFERKIRSGDPATAAAYAASQQPGADAYGADDSRLARQEFADVSPEQRQAYMNALKNGEPLPKVTVRGRQYESESHPLDHKPGIDGTQYGLVD